MRKKLSGSLAAFRKPMKTEGYGQKGSETDGQRRLKLKSKIANNMSKIPEKGKAPERLQRQFSRLRKQQKSLPKWYDKYLKTESLKDRFIQSKSDISKLKQAAKSMPKGQERDSKEGEYIFAKAHQSDLLDKLKKHNRSKQVFDKPKSDLSKYMKPVKKMDEASVVLQKDTNKSDLRNISSLKSVPKKSSILNKYRSNSQRDSSFKNPLRTNPPKGLKHTSIDEPIDRYKKLKESVPSANSLKSALGTFPTSKKYDKTKSNVRKDYLIKSRKDRITKNFRSYGIDEAKRIPVFSSPKDAPQSKDLKKATGIKKAYKLRSMYNRIKKNKLTVENMNESLITLVSLAQKGNASAFQSAFSEILANKIDGKLTDMKAEMSSNIVGEPPAEPDHLVLTQEAIENLSEEEMDYLEENYDLEQIEEVEHKPHGRQNPPTSKNFMHYKIPKKIFKGEK